MNYTGPKTSRSRRSRIFGSRITWISVAAVALLALLTTTAFMAGPGAIFTTDGTCSGTNINIFASKDAVHLDGGPVHEGAAGLANGTYCVQVTTPNDILLGMSAEGAVTVTGGEFAECYQLSDILKTASSSFTTPGYDNTTNPGGEYKVWISPTCAFAPGSNKTDNFKVEEEDECTDCNPVTFPTLKVNKYYDANANGINDDSQPITGWKVRIFDGIDYIRFTPVNIILDFDTYTVVEFPTIETNWLHTGCSVTDNVVNSTTACVPGPGLDSTTVVLMTSGDNKTVEFGNVCLGAGGGKTLGFWSNKNGQATMGDNGSLNPELSLLSGLNLVSGNSNPFDPANYTAFRNWLLSANATNMAYMLSAQLAAMELNVEAGNVQGGAFVYAPCLIGSAANENSLGFISITDLMNAANTSLGANPTTVAAGAARSYQECLKNALDRANNNLNFVQPGPCAFSFAEDQ